MNTFRTVALIVVIVSIALGAVFGLLVQSTQPPNQVFKFSAFAVHNSKPIQCSPIPKNYTNWLGIEVIGNRTGINFQSITIFSAGYDLRIDLPLNRTSLALYDVTNSTFETILVPLPNYFNAGDLLQLSLTYFFTGYSPVSQTLAETPILEQPLNC